MYHNKLEQLLALTSRLTSLSRTLGTGYFPSDVLEPVPALGEAKEDSSSQKDVTPERLAKFEKELVRGKGEVVSEYIRYLVCASHIEFFEVETAGPTCRNNDSD